MYNLHFTTTNTCCLTTLSFYNDKYNNDISRCNVCGFMLVTYLFSDDFSQKVKKVPATYETKRKGQ